MQDLASIAQRIADGFKASPEEGHAVLADCFAPQVRMDHEPPNPMDGMMAAADLRRGALMEMSAFRKVLKDFRAEASATADGDTVKLDLAYLGEGSDGAPVHAPLTCSFDFEGDRIVRLVAGAPPATGQTIMRLMAEAGLKPQDLAPRERAN